MALYRPAGIAKSTMDSVTAASCNTWPQIVSPNRFSTICSEPPRGGHLDLNWPYSEVLFFNIPVQKLAL